VIPEFVLIVNPKRLLKTALQKTESNNIIAKIARQDVLIFTLTRLIAKV
jgi:hypothetical protein